MKNAEVGNTVKIHYTGKLDDGMVFDSSREREPLEFTIGNGQLIGGFEDAVVGMNTGDMKTVKIDAEEAYGSHRSDLVIRIERDQVPEQIDTKEGSQLQLSSPDGKVLNAIITAAGDDHIMVDANHPLAGQDLTFEIELMEVKQGI
jgi:FKBP-type peptidyl-prolyl cis-trans isomerase 2